MGKKEYNSKVNSLLLKKYHICSQHWWLLVNIYSMSLVVVRVYYSEMNGFVRFDLSSVDCKLLPSDSFEELRKRKDTLANLFVGMADTFCYADISTHWQASRVEDSTWSQMCTELLQEIRY